MKSNILIVDDVPKNLQVVGTILRQQGYGVTAAMNGSEALEGLKQKAPDLILLDLMMPEMDGLEVCRRLKADMATAQIPVIFLTASNEMEHLVQGFESGAVDYVTKPFNPPELLARVRTHLELKHARERLRELNEEKNEFMGIAAHDLRSPLNAIKGYTEMILEDDEVSPENKELVQRIHTGVDRMSEMLKNLLDVNRIERGEINWKPTPTKLTPIVHRVIESLIARAKAKNQTLNFDSQISKHVMVDAEITEQVMENLISNAIKYSPTGKSIYIRLEEKDDGIQFEVKDEGPGISEADQKKLFGKFARLSAKPTGGEQAVGLGLSIVKRMMETMKGRVWCESHPNQGATFIAWFSEA